MQPFFFIRDVNEYSLRNAQFILHIIQMAGTIFPFNNSYNIGPTMHISLCPLLNKDELPPCQGLFRICVVCCCLCCKQLGVLGNCVIVYMCGQLVPLHGRFGLRTCDLLCLWLNYRLTYGCEAVSGCKGTNNTGCQTVYLFAFCNICLMTYSWLPAPPV